MNLQNKGLPMKSQYKDSELIEEITELLSGTTHGFNSEQLEVLLPLIQRERIRAQIETFDEARQMIALEKANASQPYRYMTTRIEDRITEVESLLTKQEKR